MASFKPMTQQAVTKPDTTPAYLVRLNQITAKEPAALTESEIIFMQARRSYLTDAQVNTFSKPLKALEDKRAAKMKREKEIADSQLKVKKAKK